jgi:hypothetical protein
MGALLRVRAGAEGATRGLVGALGVSSSRPRYRRQKMDSGLEGLPLSPGEGTKGTKKDQTEWTCLDSPGQMGAPFSEGKRGGTSASDWGRLRPWWLRFPPPPLDGAYLFTRDA